MSDETYCMVPDCGVETAAIEYGAGPDAIRKQPEIELFCLKHLRSLLADRKARAAAEKTQCRRYGCTNEGGLYPGGRWCPEHIPTLSHVPPTGLLAARRPIVNVELPIGDSDEKSESEIHSDLPGAISTEAILYSTELAEDDPRMPSSVKSALKSARAHDWNAKVTVAISSDELFSILMKARHPSGKSVTTRHEQIPGKAMGFKVAWFQQTPTGLPNKLGWREAMAAIKGEDPIDDRPALIEAMHVATETLGAEIVRVEVTA